MRVQVSALPILPAKVDVADDDEAIAVASGCNASSREKSEPEDDASEAADKAKSDNEAMV